jgi:hypothetical protein
MMLMLWFPYDAHLAVAVIGLAWVAHHYRWHRNTTVRRLHRLVAHDREMRT